MYVDVEDAPDPARISLITKDLQGINNTGSSRGLEMCICYSGMPMALCLWVTFRDGGFKSGTGMIDFFFCIG